MPFIEWEYMNDMQNMKKFEMKGQCLLLVCQQFLLPQFCDSIYFTGFPD